MSKRSKPQVATEKQERARKTAAHARVLTEFRAATRAIKEGERIMKASKRSLNAAGRTIDAIQKVDKLAAKVIVRGVKAQSKARAHAAKRGWL